MSSLPQDVRFAFRQFRKSPGFAAIAVLTLAVGIGANTALFSVVDSLLIRPVPYPDSERLVVLWSVPPRGGISNVSAANFLDLREQSRVFDRMGAVMMAEFNVSTRGVAERLTGLRASPGFFETLGVKPALGRAFREGDDLPGAPPVVILAYGAWQKYFGGDPNVVGRTAAVEGQPATVVGVMPADFRFVYAPELWAPLQMNAAAAPRDFHVLSVLAKLKPGVPIEQARTEMRTLAGNLAAAYPAILKGWSMDVWPWRENITGGDRRGVLVLFGAVGFVLLIACVNLANLMMARAAGRQRELALRAALGAGRGRILKQLFTESVAIALAGGCAGVLLAWWLSKAAATLVSAPILEGLAPVGIDWRVLCFTLVLSVITGLLFGIAPAWHASRLNLNSALKQAAGGFVGKRFGDVLVVIEVALALILLAGAGLMVRSLTAMYSSDPGFRHRDVVAASVTLPQSRFAGPAEVRRFHRSALEATRALPGVHAAAFGFALPLEGLAVPMRFQFASRPVPASERPRASFNYVSDGYFETLGIALRRGRLFSASDNEAGVRVAIVNDAFVKANFEREDPLGSRLLLDDRWIGGEKKGSPSPVAYEIVGVVASVKLWGPHKQGAAQIYVPIAQWPQAGGTLVVRTGVDTAAVAAAIRGVVHGVDRDIPVTSIRTMEDIATTSYAQPRQRAWVSGAFAAVGLVLAVLGLYGVISHAVGRRTREIGVRVAVGAYPARLLWMVMRRGMLLVAVGVTAGLAACAVLGRVMRGLLFGVPEWEPVTFAGVALILLAVGALATFVPARRAATVDPVVALRWE